MLVAVASVLLATSCSTEVRTWLDTGLWTQVDSAGRTLPTTITFSGRQMAVLNACDETYPLYDGAWDYYINGGDELCVSMTVDVGDEILTESYSFDFTINDAGNDITIVYDPLIGHDRVMRFKRM
ncbi:MAG: hypothetical protein IJ760_00075 [Bacteroidales bacterium]|nr:hypothetical protein [Bacteroidales bacterium]